MFWCGMLGLDNQTLENRSLARNEVLFRLGEKVTAIYFVEAGRLRLERRTFDGRVLILGTTLSLGAIRRRARLNAVARHYRVLLANYRQRVQRPACDRRFGTIAREMILERVENAQREAGPDRRAEIKRHPGNLVLPLGKVVRHDPTCAHVTETIERSQKLAAIGNLGPPSAQIHRDVDGHEKRQIACNPDDRDGEDHAYLTIELR